MKFDPLHSILLAIGFCLLSSGSLPAATPRSSGINFLAVPVIDEHSVPIVDGHWADIEWSKACKVTGLVDSATKQLGKRQCDVYFASDGNDLFIGIFSPNYPKGTGTVSLDSTDKRQEKNNKLGEVDRLEVRIDPPNSSKPSYFIFDSKGNHQVLAITGKNQSSVFEEDSREIWEVKSQTSPDGWHAEVRVKLSAFGSVTPPNQGWGVNVSRGWLYPTQMIGLRSDPQDVFPITLSKGAPALRMEKLDYVQTGSFLLKTGIREYEGKVLASREDIYEARELPKEVLEKDNGQSADLKFAVTAKETESPQFERFTLALRPGQVKTHSTTLSISKLEKGILSIETTWTRPGEAPLELYRSQIPFQPFGTHEEEQWNSRIEKLSPADGWDLEIGFFPYFEKAIAEIRLLDSPVAKKASQARLVLANETGKTWEETVKINRSGATTLETRIPSFPAGKYHATAQLLDDTGAPLSTKEKLYERKIFPWEHNRLGLSDIVPKPWVPLKVEGNGISCWGRTTRLGTNGFPGQIVSQDGSLLAQAIRIEAFNENGKSLVVQSPENGPRITSSETTAHWSASSAIESSLQLELSGTLEYDGFTWFDLRLKPGKPFKIGRLKIIIPIKSSEAALMHVQSNWARTNFSGAIPTGDGPVFSTLQTNHYGKPGGFIPHVWVGNPKRGLSWFADSDEGWALQKNKPAVEIVRNDGEVQIVLNIISLPETLSEARSIQFGVMATPIRPLTKPQKIHSQAVNWIGKDGQSVLQQHVYSPYPKNYDYDALNRALQELKGGKNEGVRLYFSKVELGAAMPEMATFGDEWRGMNSRPPYPGHSNRFPQGDDQIVTTFLTDSRIDMLVYYISELAKKTDMAGTYWDLMGISLGLPMIENGTAYKTAEGEVIPTFDTLKSRQLIKRVATMWQEIRGVQDEMEIHSTNHIGVPFYGFAPYWLNFEWLWPNESLTHDEGPWKGQQKDYIDLRPLDTYATEGNPSQFGSWISSLGQSHIPTVASNNPASDRIARTFLAMNALHNYDNGLVPTIGNREDLEFISYWDDRKAIWPSNKQIKCSAWSNGKELELVLVNMSDQAAEALVDIDAAIRHELFRISLGIWDYIKNSGDHPQSANYALEWVSPIPGKRESRRFLGPHVLNENDIRTGRVFEDQVAYGGWWIDLHPPMGVDAPNEEPAAQHEVPYLYGIPLRSLYSRNIDNLLFAGRNISASHVAFASTRVMGTCAVMGQAIGTTAAIVRRRNPTSDLRISHLTDENSIKEIQQALLRDDAFLPGIENEDPNDLAKQANCFASSEVEGALASHVTSGVSRSIKREWGSWSQAASHSWHSVGLPATISLEWEAEKTIGCIEVTFCSGLERELVLTLSEPLNKKVVRGPQPEIARDYNVILDDQCLFEIRGNIQRKRRHILSHHHFGRTLKIEVLSANGLDHARIYEIRVYEDNASNVIDVR